jgi:hypothetical protein
MTTSFRLCGNTVEHKNPCWWLTGEWIKEMAEQMNTHAATCSGFQIEEKLNALCFSAREILNSTGSGRALDSAAQVIDKITQCDELHVLSKDVRTIELITRDCLVNDTYLTRFAEDYGNDQEASVKLKSYCDSLKNIAQGMKDTAIALQAQIKAETQTLTNQLTEMSDSLPRDCFRVIAEYSLT